MFDRRKPTAGCSANGRRSTSTIKCKKLCIVYCSVCCGPCASFGGIYKGSNILGDAGYINSCSIISRRWKLCSTGASGPAAHRLHQMSLVLEPVMSGLREQALAQDVGTGNCICPAHCLVASFLFWCIFQGETS